MMRLGLGTVDTMNLGMKTAGLTLVATFSAGCATAYQPPSGIVWGYTGESATIPSLRETFTHLPIRALCEASLAKDLVGRRLKLGEGCRELAISPGSRVWIFSQSTAWDPREWRPDAATGARCSGR